MPKGRHIERSTRVRGKSRVKLLDAVDILKKETIENYFGEQVLQALSCEYFFLYYLFIEKNMKGR